MGKKKTRRGTGKTAGTSIRTGDLDRIKDSQIGIAKELKQINVVYHVYGSLLQQGKIEDIPKEKREQLSVHLSHIKEAESENWRALNKSLGQLGIPVTLPLGAQELQIDITEREREKVEAAASSIDETQEKLAEVGVKEILGDPEAYNRLGIFYLESGKLEKAKGYFDRAVEIDPKNAHAWSNLRSVYAKLGDWKQAIRCSEKTLEIDPENAHAWTGLALSYDGLGDPRQAIRCCEKALEIETNPKNAVHIWAYIGSMYAKLGDWKQAIRFYKEALEIDPENATVWEAVGDNFVRLGDGKSAISCYKKALEIDSGNTHAWAALGTVYTESGDHRRAISCYEKALETKPEDASVLKSTWIALGLSHAQLRDHRRAISCYEKALETKPEDDANARALDVGTLKLLGQAYEMSSNQKEAQRCYRKAEELESQG